MAGGLERHILHHSCYFFLTRAKQRLFQVQPGVMGKATQRSKAAVRRIQAAMGSVPRPCSLRWGGTLGNVTSAAQAPPTHSPPLSSCSGGGRKPAFSHCHCVPDRFINLSLSHPHNFSSWLSFLFYGRGRGRGDSEVSKGTHGS